VGSRLTVDVQSMGGQQYFSRFDPEVHFGADLQNNLLSGISWSGGEAPHDRSFVVEVVGAKTPSRRAAVTPLEPSRPGRNSYGAETDDSASGRGTFLMGIWKRDSQIFFFQIGQQLSQFFFFGVFLGAFISLVDEPLQVGFLFPRCSYSPSRPAQPLTAQ